MYMNQAQRSWNTIFKTESTCRCEMKPYRYYRILVPVPYCTGTSTVMGGASTNTGNSCPVHMITGYGTGNRYPAGSDTKHRTPVRYRFRYWLFCCFIFMYQYKKAREKNGNGTSNSKHLFQQLPAKRYRYLSNRYQYRILPDFGHFLAFACK